MELTISSSMTLTSTWMNALSALSSLIIGPGSPFRRSVRYTSCCSAHDVSAPKKRARKDL